MIGFSNAGYLKGGIALSDAVYLPPGFDWSQWVERWEHMQERYLVNRAGRFAEICRLITCLLYMAR